MKLPTSILTLVLAAICFLTIQASDLAAEQQKSVLITGTSSGIGRATTELLASKGHFVYAGVLNEKEKEIWKDNPNVRAVILDVTKPEQIAAAVELVRKEGRGLHGLVNNAGIAVAGALIEVDEKDFHRVQNVNLYGVYRITKAFAPFIIESKGRISTVGSISGAITPPAFGPYTISKFAVEGFGATLHVEMAKLGVHCSLIEPGPHRTQIGNSMVKRMKAEGKLDLTHSRFKKEMEKAIHYATEVIANSGDPKNVAMVIYDSLFEENPKPRYMVVSNKRESEMTIRAIMKTLKQFNERHPYDISEEDLIKMLKQTLPSE